MFIKVSKTVYFFRPVRGTVRIGIGPNTFNPYSVQPSSRVRVHMHVCVSF